MFNVTIIRAQCILFIMWYWFNCILNALLYYRYDVEFFPKEKSVITKEEIILGIKGKSALVCSLNDKIDKDILKSAGTKSLETVPQHGWTICLFPDWLGNELDVSFYLFVCYSLLTM